MEKRFMFDRNFARLSPRLFQWVSVVTSSETSSRSYCAELWCSRSSRCPVDHACHSFWRLRSSLLTPSILATSSSCLVQVCRLFETSWCPRLHDPFQRLHARVSLITRHVVLVCDTSIVRTFIELPCPMVPVCLRHICFSKKMFFSASKTLWSSNTWSFWIPLRHNHSQSSWLSPFQRFPILSPRSAVTELLRLQILRSTICIKSKRYSDVMASFFRSKRWKGDYSKTDPDIQTQSIDEKKDAIRHSSLDGRILMLPKDVNAL